MPVPGKNGLDIKPIAIIELLRYIDPLIPDSKRNIMKSQLLELIYGRGFQIHLHDMFW